MFNQKFGYGTVIHIDADKLEIEFDNSGMKKVMDIFVIPADMAK